MPDKTVRDELREELKRFLENHKRNIVLVDDDSGYRDLAASIIRVHNCDVVEAGDGEEAIEVINRTKPDIVFLDMRMPKKTGLDVIRHFQDVGHEFPIVLMTGYLGEIAGLVKPAPNVLVIEKPSTYEQLQRTLVSLLTMKVPQHA